MTRRLRAAGRAVRLGDWWVYKMGPVLGLVLAEVLVDGMEPGPATGLATLTALSGALLAAYGHVLNDAADIAVDAAAGKANAVSGWAPWMRATVAGALLAGAFGVWTLRPIPAPALAALATAALALALYALPPARLKERGAFGVAADAAYAHALPVVFVLAVFGGNTDGWSLAWALALAVWAASYGVRGILLHQLWDAEADRAAGLPTLATRAGPGAVRRWGRGAFAVEVAAAAAVVGVLGVRQPVVAGALAAVAGATALAKRRGWVPPSFDPMPAAPGGHVPFVLVYAVWPALVVGVALALRDPGHIPLAASVVVLLWGGVGVVLGEWGHAARGATRRTADRVWRRLRGDGR